MSNKQIYNPIIPVDQIFYNTRNREVIQWKNLKELDLDYRAMAIFSVFGFMLDDDTFYNDIKVCKPSTDYQINENNQIISQQKTWNWHYSPKERSFNGIVDEFSHLLNDLIKKKINDKSILLPLSGGLDSRTLFVPVKTNSNLTLSSYEFEGGFSETETAEEISQQFSSPLFIQKIQRGYLWNKIDELYEFNHCFTDFTHPRQAAVLNNWKGLGNTVLLGHWGDVLFDKQADSEAISYNEQMIQLKKKIIKPGGIELANDLWKNWGLMGTFESYLDNRLDKLYKKIKIDCPSARIRAFKSLYWAPRWTSINLSMFKTLGELVIPYYDDEMCKFICTVPERYLVGRKIQIEYIKKNCPEVARLPWQKYYPLNLYQYQRFNHSHYYIIRAVRKAKRILQQYFSKSPDLITRNWELQFLGEQNFTKLKKILLKRNKFNKLIPQTIIRKYLEKFQADPVQYAHPLSMLLTLAVFLDKHYSE